MENTSILPPRPNNIGKRRFLITVPDGKRLKFTIKDEILRNQRGMREKLLCLQLITFEDRREEIRLGYYIIGKKPARSGRWVWGQYCTFIPASDFRALFEGAVKRGWNMNSR